MGAAVLASPTDTGSVETSVHLGAEGRWREAQVVWAALPVARRLAVLKRARHRMAELAVEFAAAVSPELARTTADTMVAELLPLLEACKFLEREAEAVLTMRRPGRRGLPFWLARVDSEVRRVALGKVLVIGPGNYPLFLPGVQALQGLAAGNAVIWKPGRGGKAVADLFAAAMYEAGLPQELLRVTDESVAAGEAEIARGADKVFFTGSAATGRGLMRRLAETATPCVMELSGCDGVVGLASADMGRLVKALAFGMRLNGSATCMAPRRVFLAGVSQVRRDLFVRELQAALGQIAGVRLGDAVRVHLRGVVEKAVGMGARMLGDLEAEQRPVLVTDVTAEMEISRQEVFAPLLMLMEVRDKAELLAAMEACPYALTVAVFGDEREALALTERITAGTVLVNDLIAPTADPRVPFGGRRTSGFGVTRGAEGLLEMSAVKVVSVQRGKSVRHYEATGPEHVELFGGVILASHGAKWGQRWRGLKRVVKAARRIQ